MAFLENTEKKTLRMPVKISELELDLPKRYLKNVTPSTNKKFKFLPVKNCEMNDCLFEEKPRNKTLRKALWPEHKPRKYSTVMKADKTKMRTSVVKNSISDKNRMTYISNEPITPTTKTTEIKKCPNVDKSELILEKLDAVLLRFDKFESEINIKVDKLKLEIKNNVCKNCSSKYSEQNIQSNINYFPKTNESINTFSKIADDINLTDQNLLNKLEKLDLFVDKIEETKKNLIDDANITEIITEAQDRLQNIDGNLINVTKKKSVTFELLESKIKDESPLVFHDLSFSDVNSPNDYTENIDWLIIDDLKIPLTTKSLSVTNIPNISNIKNCSKPLSKSYSSLENTVCMYNEIRDKVKFLCTPKKTKLAGNLMTPSVKTNETKLISRRVQSQLQMLD